MLQRIFSSIRGSRGFTVVEIIVIVAGIAIVITVVVILVTSGGDDSDASMPDPACDTTLTAKGETENASETSRFGPHRNWPAARTAMIGRVEAEAESKASDSLDDQFDGYSCLDGCPTPTRANQVTYNTSSSVSGSRGWGWIRYDALASSQASDNFTCE